MEWYCETFHCRTLEKFILFEIGTSISILRNEIYLWFLIVLLTPLSNDLYESSSKLYIHTSWDIRRFKMLLYNHFVHLPWFKKPETRTASSPFNVADLCIQKFWRRFSWLFVSFKSDRMFFLECEQCNSLNGNIHDWFMFLVCFSFGWLQWYEISFYQISLQKK